MFIRLLTVHASISLSLLLSSTRWLSLQTPLVSSLCHWLPRALPGANRHERPYPCQDYCDPEFVNALQTSYSVRECGRSIGQKTSIEALTLPAYLSTYSW